MAAVLFDDGENFRELVVFKLFGAEGVAGVRAVNRHFENHHDSLPVALVEPGVRRGFGVKPADLNALRTVCGNVLFDVFAVVVDIAVGKTVLSAQEVGFSVQTESAVANFEAHEHDGLEDGLDDFAGGVQQFGLPLIEMRVKRP